MPYVKRNGKVVFEPNPDGWMARTAAAGDARKAETAARRDAAQTAAPDSAAAKATRQMVNARSHGALFNVMMTVLTGGIWIIVMISRASKTSRANALVTANLAARLAADNARQDNK